MTTETQQILSFKELLIEAHKTYEKIFNGEIGIDEIEQLKVLSDFIASAEQ